VDKKRTNTNALAGYKCPKCGSLEPFRMVSVCMTLWSDQGTEESTEYDIAEDGACECVECKFVGPTSGFLISERYVRSGGTKCPVCDSDNIENKANLEADNGIDWQDVECMDCNATWRDEYKLTGIRDIEVKECE